MTKHDPVRLAVAWSLADDFECDIEHAIKLLDAPVGAHSGDCTKECHTCHACFIEEVNRITAEVKRVT